MAKLFPCLTFSIHICYVDFAFWNHENSSIIIMVMSYDSFSIFLFFSEYWAESRETGEKWKGV
jgi:hypothetical protein